MDQFRLSIPVLLIAMTSIQLGASFAKRLFPEVGAAGAATLRICIAALFLAAIWRPWKGRLARRQWILIAFYGVSLGMMNLLFYLALARIPLGVVVALEFTGPLTIALISSRSYLDVVWAVLAIFGILLIVPIFTLAGAADPLGILFALGAGFCWALYIVFGQKIGHSVQVGRATALGMIIAALAVLPFGIAQSGLKLLSVEVLPIAVLVAVLSSALPYTLEMLAMRKLPAKTFSILMSLEPGLAALSGLIFLDELLTFYQWLAIACIIIASLGSCFSLTAKTINS